MIKAFTQTKGTKRSKAQFLCLNNFCFTFNMHFVKLHCWWSTQQKLEASAWRICQPSFRHYHSSRSEPIARKKKAETTWTMYSPGIYKVNDINKQLCHKCNILKPLGFLLKSYFCRQSLLPLLCHSLPPFPAWTCFDDDKFVYTLNSTVETRTSSRV